MSRLPGWTQVQAPDTRGAAEAVLRAGELFGQAGSNMGEMFRRWREDQRRDRSAAMIPTLAGVRDGSSAEAAIAAVAAGMDPRDMTSDFQTHLLGTNQRGLGMDLTREQMEAQRASAASSRASAGAASANNARQQELHDWQMLARRQAAQTAGPAMDLWARSALPPGVTIDDLPQVNGQLTPRSPDQDPGVASARSALTGSPSITDFARPGQMMGRAAELMSQYETARNQQSDDARRIAELPPVVQPMLEWAHLLRQPGNALTPADFRDDITAWADRYGDLQTAGRDQRTAREAQEATERERQAADWIFGNRGHLTGDPREDREFIRRAVGNDARLFDEVMGAYNDTFGAEGRLSYLLNAPEDYRSDAGVSAHVAGMTDLQATHELRNPADRAYRRIMDLTNSGETLRPVHEVLRDIAVNGGLESWATTENIRPAVAIIRRIARDMNVAPEVLMDLLENNLSSNLGLLGRFVTADESGIRDILAETMGTDELKLDTFTRLRSQSDSFSSARELAQQLDQIDRQLATLAARADDGISEDAVRRVEARRRRIADEFLEASNRYYTLALGDENRARQLTEDARERINPAEFGQTRGPSPQDLRWNMPPGYVPPPGTDQAAAAAALARAEADADNENLMGGVDTGPTWLQNLLTSAIGEGAAGPSGAGLRGDPPPVRNNPASTVVDEAINRTIGSDETNSPLDAPSPVIGGIGGTPMTGPGFAPEPVGGGSARVDQIIQQRRSPGADDFLARNPEPVGDGLEDRDAFVQNMIRQFYGGLGANAPTGNFEPLGSGLGGRSVAQFRGGPGAAPDPEGEGAPNRATLMAQRSIMEAQRRMEEEGMGDMNDPMATETPLDEISGSRLLQQFFQSQERSQRTNPATSRNRIAQTMRELTQDAPAIHQRFFSDRRVLEYLQNNPAALEEAQRDPSGFFRRRSRQILTNGQIFLL
jgi:hypothetical protein